MENSTAKEEEPCAYAKLWGQLDGKPFHTYVTALPSTLGRGSTATEGEGKTDAFINLGRSKALSREHGEGEGGVARFQIISLDMLPPKLSCWRSKTLGRLLACSSRAERMGGRIMLIFFVHIFFIAGRKFFLWADDQQAPPNSRVYTQTLCPKHISPGPP